MSLRSDTLHKPCGQMMDQGLRTHSPDTQLMELILHLQQTVEDYIMQLETRHLQPDLVPEEESHSEATKKQEASLIQLTRQVVSLLLSGATGGLELCCPAFPWTPAVMLEVHSRPSHPGSPTS